MSGVVVLQADELYGVVLQADEWYGGVTDG